MSANLPEKCPACGAKVANGRDGCQALFHGLTMKAYEDNRYGRYHRLIVDIYAMQHLDPYCLSAKSYAAHLTGLCCGVEMGGETRVNSAVQKWLNGRSNLEKPPILPHLGALTIADLPANATPEAFNAFIHQWATAVWDAYQSQHALARHWIALALQATTK